jgi:hypothetical protein
MYAWQLLGGAPTFIIDLQEFDSVDIVDIDIAPAQIAVRAFAYALLPVLCISVLTFSIQHLSLCQVFGMEYVVCL